MLTIGDVRFGVCHGHQVVPWGDLDSLAMMSRQMDVDGVHASAPRLRAMHLGVADARRRACAVLITGHTHEARTAPPRR